MKFLTYRVTGPEPVELSHDLGGIFAAVCGRRCDAIVLDGLDVRMLVEILLHGTDTERAALGELMNSGWLTRFRPGA